jgi:hypothetical protein
MTVLPSSHRRPAALTDTDYDHEILLVDHTRRTDTQLSARSRSQSVTSIRPGPPERVDTLTRRHSDSQLRKTSMLRKEIAKRRYSKYQDRREGESTALVGVVTDSSSPDTITTTVDPDDPDRPTTSATDGGKYSGRESAIDILYENQRGGFLCGIALFSSKALGAADKPPWTNVAQKPSATNITNAQPPDPSWEWAWPEWKINHDDNVDEDGWEYSFMFYKKCSWHGPTWWNSCVRRRAWIRKRVKKETGYHVQEGHMLTSDYFTIHATASKGHSRSTSLAGSQAEDLHRLSTQARLEREEAGDREHIEDIGHLLKSLKWSRIDREKTEAVESFVEHGGDDLFYLREKMPEIMGQFIFQASRRYLLAHLLKRLDEASAHHDEHGKEGEEEGQRESRRMDNLKAAVQAADDEVKRLEFWSDVKQMAENGEIKGAVDASQGWDQKWVGLDVSGPKDVITDRELPGFRNGEDADYDENIKPGASREEKGKGKA